MGEFIQVLVSYGFMQNAVMAGVLASLACGIAGTYVVVKRITFISGGIAHAVLGGMGIAYYLGVNPMIGAIAFALLSAVLLGIVSIRVRQHEDTVIGALWAIGMAVGVIFISRSPGYNVDLMSFLFGNILMVSRTDLVGIAVLDAAIVALVLVFYRQLSAVCFDEEYARLLGIRVELIYILLLCLVALTVVVLVQVVGLILVIALLTLPAAIAGLFSGSLGRMMVIASVLGLVFTTIGLAVSYQPDLPSGATIIVIAGAGYLLSLALRRALTVLARSHSISE